MSLSIDPPPYPVILNQPRFWQSLRVGSRKSDWFNALGLTAVSFGAGFFGSGSRTRRGLTISATSMGVFAGVILAYERSFLRLSGYHENRKECLNAGIDYEAVLKRQQAEQRAAQLAHERNAL